MDSQYLKSYKPVVVAETGLNGGRQGQNLITSARHSLFPIVPYGLRISGKTRYRMEYNVYEDPSNIHAYNVLRYLPFYSNGGDRFAICSAVLDETQADLLARDPAWVGCGQLNTGISAGVGSLIVDMEGDDIVFIPGGKVVIHNRFKTGQDFEDGSTAGKAKVRIGDSCQYNSGTSKWEKISATTDITYPKGIRISDTVCHTEETGSWSKEFLDLKSGKTEAEVIGTGNGSSATPTLTDLAAITNGLFVADGFKPTITTLCGAVERTVYIEADGTCSGYCTAGEINLATGVWVTDITWLTAPDNTEDIEITYYDKPYVNTGSQYTITFDPGSTPQNDYLAGNTYISGCVEEVEEIQPSYDGFTVTSSAGTYNDTTNPIEIQSAGAERDRITMTFTSATNFTATGLYSGALGAGNVGEDFTITNTAKGYTMLIMRAAGFGGTFAPGDTIVFEMYTASDPIWWREIIPMATPAQPENFYSLGFYGE